MAHRQHIICSTPTGITGHIALQAPVLVDVDDNQLYPEATTKYILQKPFIQGLPIDCSIYGVASLVEMYSNVPIMVQQ